MTLAGLRFVANPPRGPLGWRIMLPVAAVTLGVLWWAADGTQLSVSTFIAGWPWIADFLSRMLPPNLSYAQHLIKPAIETVQIALWGTLLGVVLALPVCFFAARNLSPHAGIFHALRQVLNVMRGINEIILALIFVAAVGLGPFAGVLGIAFHTWGSTAKLWAEAIENIPPGPLEAAAATGASRVKVIAFALLPDVAPSMVSVGLFWWEFNVRASTVLGVVGAGGIGQELKNSMDLLLFPRLLTIILLILVTVTVIDHTSEWLRRKLE
jgi:phosphonate transport system permease protein